MRSTRQTLRRHASTVSEPPSIPELLASFAKEHQVLPATVRLLMAFAKTGQALTIHLSQVRTNPPRLTSCEGFSERSSERLLISHKLAGQGSVQAWIQSLLEQLAQHPKENYLLLQEPPSIVPDELSDVRTLYACLLNSNTVIVLINPQSLKKATIPLLEPFLSVVTHLLAQEASQHLAQKSLQQLSSALDQQGEATLYLSTRSLSIKQASLSAEKLLGVKEIVGKRLWNIFDKDKESFKEELATLSQPESPSSSDEQESRCWKLKHSSAELVVRFPGKALVSGSSCLIVLVKRADTYEKRILDAEEKARSKSEFMAHLGHEIRTPLSCILTIFPLINESPLNEEQKRHMKILHQSSLDMMMIVNDFLDMAKLENNAMQLHESEASMEDMIRLLEGGFRAGAELEHIDLSFTLDSSVPAKLYLDFNRLRQVIQNLLNNAIKFTREGGSVSVHISAVAHSGHHRVRIQVEDTGIGIAPEDLKLIFRPFRQVDESSVQQQGGIGLGLPISKKLVKLMDHGSIKCHSELGQGSRFIIEFNSPILDNQLLLKKYEDLLSGKRVLIVDDISNNRISMYALLEKWGLQPMTSASAEDAIGTAFSGKDAEPFDLALLDLRMPNMNGVGLANWIRRRGYNFPMILLSSSPEDSEGLSAEEKALFKFCLLRPVPERRLLAHVAAALGSQDRVLSLLMNPGPALPSSGPRAGGSVAGQATATERRRHSRLPNDVRATRVLVAEDSPLGQRVMESLLRKLGYSSIQFANSGTAVLELCEKPSSHFDLILMDMRMPVLDGFSASKQLSNAYAQRRLARPKIIATTSLGASSNELLEWCSKGYIDEVVGKPIDLQLLRDKIDRLLSEVDQRRRLSTPI